jgi:catechol 2,3-dioxygenase-like lactoylglutathione lyase family enzyme/ketosteroid isomerase-like protein
MDSQAL